jgi:hypothetical protein
VDGVLESVSTFGIPGFDRNTIEQQVESETGLDLQTDLIDWMGDIGLFVQGTNLLEISGGAVIETSDPETSKQTLEQLSRYLVTEGAPIRGPSVEGVEGFGVTIPGAPQPVNVVTAGDRVVIAYGDEATRQALESESTLVATDRFKVASDALGEGYNVAGYFDIPPILELADNLGAAEDDTYQDDVKLYLEPLSHLVFGSRVEGDRFVARIVLGVE